MSLQRLNYSRLFENNPTEYGRVVNQNGQEVVFYEHPIYGDEYPVIAVFHENKIAVKTDFYDIDDMYPGSDYLPVLINDQVECAFMLDLK